MNNVAAIEILLPVENMSNRKQRSEQRLLSVVAEAVELMRQEKKNEPPTTDPIKRAIETVESRSPSTADTVGEAGRLFLLTMVRASRPARKNPKKKKGPAKDREP